MGNDAADEAAEFGRRRVNPAIIDARRNLSGVCRRCYPIISDSHRFFIAISRSVVNHDGREGTAPLVLFPRGVGWWMPCVTMLCCLDQRLDLSSTKGFQSLSMSMVPECWHGEPWFLPALLSFVVVTSALSELSSLSYAVSDHKLAPHTFLVGNNACVNPAAGQCPVTGVGTPLYGAANLPGEAFALSNGPVERVFR